MVGPGSAVFDCFERLVAVHVEPPALFGAVELALPPVAPALPPVALTRPPLARAPPTLVDSAPPAADPPVALNPPVLGGELVPSPSPQAAKSADKPKATIATRCPITEFLIAFTDLSSNRRSPRADQATTARSGSPGSRRAFAAAHEII
jgi:hypothetical protein